MPDHQYRNTTIYVRDPGPGMWDPAANDPDPTLAGPAQVGEYGDIVFRHLDQIRAFPLGTQFFTDITNFGKRQVICYIGTNVLNDNSCSGSGAGKKKIVGELGTATWSGARIELNKSIHRWQAAHPGQNANDWLAQQLLQTPLHRWDPATTDPNSPLNPQDVGPADASWNTMVGILSKQLTEYRTGRMALKTTGPTREIFDLLVYILRDYLEDGDGTNCLVRYTPLKINLPIGGQRPAQIALFHELVHAYYEAQGKNMSGEDSLLEWNGRYYELAAVGLPPFDTAVYGENQMRALFNIAARPSYS